MSNSKANELLFLPLDSKRLNRRTINSKCSLLFIKRNHLTLKEVRTQKRKDLFLASSDLLVRDNLRDLGLAIMASQF